MPLKPKKEAPSKKGANFKTSHSRFLIKIGKESAENSIRETKALGLPITYVEGDKIIREEANGRKEIIGQI